MKKISFCFFLIFPLCLLSFNVGGQQSLNLATCQIEEYAINDHSDSDGDGVICEAKIVLSNSAFYEGDEICQLSNINWTVIVDLNGDGTNDLEYSSSLPSDDNDLDDTNNNGIPDLYIPSTINNEVQNIMLPDIEGPSSNHSVTWSVYDNCDFENMCTTSFTVVDKNSPTPFCVSLFTLVFDDYEMEIYAEDFNVGVFDNCTDQEDIRISFSSDSIVPTRKITCDDVQNSPVHLNVYFWDESDNIDFCTVFLTAVLGMVDCFPGGVIDGTVRDRFGNPLEGVEVTLDADLLEYPLTRLTDSEGKYSFGYHEVNFNYRLSASFDDSYLSDVSTLDLVYIVRYLLGIQTFQNPYQIIAADINGDKAVKANDLFVLRKLILGVITKISTHQPWTFFRSDFEFINPLDPFPQLLYTNQKPYTYEFDSIKNGGYDFIGTKTGDVNY